MLRNFAAVMKDSFREAVSGWILQTLLILIALFLLLVFSTSLRPLTFGEAIDLQLGWPNFLFRAIPDTGSPQVAVENATSQNPAEPWAGGGEFDLVVRMATEKDLGRAKNTVLPLDRTGQRFLVPPGETRKVERFLAELGTLKGVTVTDISPPREKEKKPDPDAADGPRPAAKPITLRFRVTATGTSYADQLDWPHELTAFFAVNTGLQRPARTLAYYCQNYVVNGLGGWVFCLVGVIVTAGFIPNLLRKGALDLVIAKPIGRVELLLYKYVGGLLFFLILVMAAVLGMLLAVGVKTGVWSAHFLSVVPLLTLQFAILYAVSTLFGVLTRNALVAIMATLLAWGLFFVVGLVADGTYTHDRENAAMAKALADGRLGGVDENGREITPQQMMERLDPNRPLFGFIPVNTFPVWRVIHAVTPRTVQLDTWGGNLIAHGVLSERGLKERGWDVDPPASLVEVILVNLAFITLMLAFAGWRFATRDP